MSNGITNCNQLYVNNIKMDDSALTSQAIAELMRQLPGQNNQITLGPQERKINPLGRPNKRFLGRTINNVLRHNKREIERTQANCYHKLQELNDRYENRKKNVFYTRDARNSPSNRRKRESRSKKHKKRHKARSSSSRSRTPSEESRRRTHKKERKKKHKKRTKSKERRRSSTYVENEEKNSSISTAVQQNSDYNMHSNNLAFAFAMAYSQAFSAQQRPQVQHTPTTPTSPSRDIIRELMSDDENDHRKLRTRTLSIASSNEEHGILTIDLSSQEEQSDSNNANVSEMESEASSRCISLIGNSGYISSSNSSDSELEIIENEITVGSESRAIGQNRAPIKYTKPSNSNVEATVDLTED